MYSTRVIKGARFPYALLKDFKGYPTTSKTNKITVICFDKKEADAVMLKHHDNAKIIVCHFAPITEKQYLYISKLECFYIVCVTLEELNNFVNKPIINDERRTYISFGSNTLRKYFIHLRLNSWSHVREAKYVDYYMLTHAIVHNSFGFTKCKLKQSSDITVLKQAVDKDLMYQNFGSEFVPEVIPLEKLDDNFGLTIFKPNEGSLGQGIFVINTKDKDWRDTVTRLYKKEDEPYAICRYIDNPLLFKGRKFHLRSLMMLTSWGTFSTFPISRILHATLPYQHGDYLNIKIHDTHARSTDGYPIFPNDLKVSKEIIDDLYSQITHIHKVCLEKIPIKCYPESKECYNIFGLDLLIDDNYKVWVLEINKTPLMQSYFDNGPSDMFDSMFSNWIINNVISRLQNN